ncbi:hypothetical protein BDR04DRAFT_1111873 [Suillus decipiens]|nr:hypothetical protein BDR04DRAFT_1111878 [Suillus decipiens]KAG2062993.1 hypothetical protein BDR04DRAFT_1111873 [Suillus decipiens]
MGDHTKRVNDIVHLPGGQRIMTCSSSWDGLLQQWDLESGTQIGDDWADDGDKNGWESSMALSLNGKTIVSGSGDGKVKL